MLSSPSRSEEADTVVNPKLGLVERDPQRWKEKVFFGPPHRESRGSWLMVLWSKPCRNMVVEGDEEDGFCQETAVMLCAGCHRKGPTG